MKTSIHHRKNRLGALLGIGLLTLGQALGQTLPLEIHQNKTKYNYQSASGVPLSTTANDPAGSDGRAPTGTEQQGANLTINPPTANQFGALLSWGAVAAPATPGTVASPNINEIGGSTTYAGNAANLGVPHGGTGTARVVLQRAQVGAPFLNRPVSFLFGGIISPPEENEDGNKLEDSVLPSSYWLGEPHLLAAETNAGHTAKGYYYSPHARSVFAIQPGPVEIIWRKATPYEGTPNDSGDATMWYQSGGNFFRLYKKRYIVSGSAAKAPRKIYWNQAGYIGPQVNIPASRIGKLEIVYNSSFPERVAKENGIPANESGAESSGGGINIPTEGGNVTVPGGGETVYTKTLWHQRDALMALNAEGRVFVELLGDLREDGNSRYHLGFEIVDVFKHSTPADVTVELGDRVTAWPPAENKDDSHLHPQPNLQMSGDSFVFQSGGQQIKYHAVRETKNLNDYQVHWMESGQEGILWPSRHVRYKFVWPDNPARYSHYVRPAAANNLEASLTAVPMPVENTPTIQYQDPMDGERAFFTDNFGFYTILDVNYPAHRTLLRFSAGGEVYFERVFSWLDQSVKAGTIATSALGAKTWVPSRALKIWGNAAGTATGLTYNAAATDANGDAAPVTQLSSGFLDSTQLNAPRHVTQTVNVGDRINAPTSELGSGGADYWAGYILKAAGTAFNPNAYVDPLSHGFEKANKGAIIPVNAAPGNNVLEVYWYRKNSADPVKGFKPIYWPSILGRYTIAWPTAPKEIILASNAGSGELTSLQAKGSIYVQNTPGAEGYNPNEEHALMLAGRAYALRDDLNSTSGTGYSSHPFVLLEFTEADGRPAMSAFQVLRDDPGNRIVFDYITEAGKILQAPMPLPLLAKPRDGSRNFNTEPPVTGTDGDRPTNSSGTQVDATGSYAHYNAFTYEDRKGNHWVYRGLHAGPPALEAGTYTVDGDGNGSFGNPADAVAKVNEAFSYTIHASRRAATLKLSAATATPLPDWLKINGLTLSGTPAGADTASLSLDLGVAPLDGSASVTKTLAITVSADSGDTALGQAPMSLSYTVGNVTQNLGDRPPALAEAPSPANSFKMRFYYKTLAGFAWPGEASPPPVGSIVPYLRPKDGSGGFTGEATNRDTTALEIVYRPVWPADTPVLNLSETLTDAKKGLPAVRGQASLRVLYQQSIAKSVDSGGNAASVILHDPTREKSYPLGQAATDLQSIPASVNTSAYQGKTYFPNLPPYLSQRLFFDPNRGTKGALVFQGKFVDEVVGEDYLLLNVLSGTELALAKGLCPAGDDNKGKWDAAVAGLATSVQTFYEPSATPGKWVANTGNSQVAASDTVAGDAAPGAVTVGIGALAGVVHDDTAVDSYALSASGPGTGYVTLISNDGNDPGKAGLPVSVHILRVGQPMYRGEIKVLYSSNPLDEQVTFQHTADLGGKHADFEYEWLIQPPVDGASPKVYYADSDSSYDAANPKALAAGWTLLDNGSGAGIHRYTLGGSGIQTLSDNYIIMRYRPTRTTHPGFGDTDGDGSLSNAETEAAWSEWTVPQLAEGWIKRVLAGINPFNQRTTDMFSNSVNTQGSILTSAGKRWEGNIALNLESINDHGLISIYETVLNRGKDLSIEASPGIDYGPANDALLLAAGYLNDLYMMVGNEAYADAANPTIGIGTKDRTYGDVATALFAFKGQMATLLEEELGLLRGRDDFMQPGVETGPVYNRLFWNYTRGIDSGEVIYALNYNIQEDQGEELDGSINAADAARMYPQGHGDAYGHYLTALKGYYKLLTDADFTWAPRTEAVTVLGKPVQVDYMDERKFAAAAAALARTGQQVFDLTWRKDYTPDDASGWGHFTQTRANDRRTHSDGAATAKSTRHWGMDHWAARTGIGTMVNWVVGNAMLPAEDTDPSHEGIQKIDRTTVPELQELAAVATSLQISLDNAEAGLNPLGLPEDGIAFDIDPDEIQADTHFDQIYGRATRTLGNAMAAFDDAKDVTRMMRSEEDSINEFQAQVAMQELAYTHQLIELYGTPYSDDIGVGKTYKQGYTGPDLLHYNYVDDDELTAASTAAGVGAVLNPRETLSVRLDVQNVPTTWDATGQTSISGLSVVALDASTYAKGSHYITYELGPHGFFSKPATWAGRRESPGKIQSAISQIIKARNAAQDALGNHEWFKYMLDRQLKLFKAQNDTNDLIRVQKSNIADMNRDTNNTILALETSIAVAELLKELADDTFEIMDAGTPDNVIFGFSNGGNFMKVIKAVFGAGKLVTKAALNTGITTMSGVAGNLANKNDDAVARIELGPIGDAEWNMGRKEVVLELENAFNDLRGNFTVINQRLVELAEAKDNLLTLVAEGNRVQKEREIFRQRASAVVQGFRTRDAAFRIFRNEKLERYKTLYDLSARYAYLAAKAYDYETGLLHTDQGKAFLSRIVQSRSLGVVKDGQPQYAGSNTGDPGLSSVLAEMNTDWSVLKGRLGFNNPDTYGTTVSMRNEQYRVLPGADGADNWRDVLENARVADLRGDADVRRHCMQIDNGDGLPVPGFVIEFSTVITDGLNLFGKPLAPADSYFSPSSFANKIHAVGIAFDGYKGITDPNSNGSGVAGAGGDSPASPGGGFLDPKGLSATPYVYLVPVGLDSMRSPPLGDASVVRTWNVQDVAVPLPFNIGASELSTKKLWQSADSLSEDLFSVRKHQAFRAVSSAGVFKDNPNFLPDNYTNNRLIGRSVWNSKWKLVIPGRALLNDPDEGLDRFIQTVRDIQVHFRTYSYSGN